MSNPLRTRAIADAKVKTDTIDASPLAELLAADYLPTVWQPDPATRALRRRVAGRSALVAERTRLRNRVGAVLMRNLVGCPWSDPFGLSGRAWLAEVELSSDERELVDRTLRLLDGLETEIGLAEAASPGRSSTIAGSGGCCRSRASGCRPRSVSSLSSVTWTVPSPEQARRLSLALPDLPPVGRPSGLHRPHQPRRPGPRPGPAGRGRSRRHPGARPAARLLRPDRRATRSRDRDRGRRPQADRPRLSPPAPLRRLPLCTDPADGHQ